MCRNKNVENLILTNNARTAQKGEFWADIFKSSDTVYIKEGNFIIAGNHTYR